MYGYINGKVTKVNPKYIILENNGIGYILIVRGNTAPKSVGVFP